MSFSIETLFAALPHNVRETFDKFTLKNFQAAKRKEQKHHSNIGREDAEVDAQSKKKIKKKKRKNKLPAGEVGSFSC